MKKIVLGFILAIILPISHAQDSTTMDWSGVYVTGGASAVVSGETNESQDFLPLQKKVVGILGIGYNHQINHIVIGTELTHTLGEMNEKTFANDFYLDSLYDIKAKLGYTQGNYLAYVTAGRSLGKFNEDMLTTPLTYTVRGNNFGMGIDYAVNSNFIIGLEYVYRDMGKAYNNDFYISNANVKIAYKF